MRVTFSRLADHQWADVLIERDDGVVYRMHAGPVTDHIPHDLVHFTVEDALGMPDGIWGAIAGGAVFKSMTHVSGRRPPHAADTSAALIREHRALLQRAELIGGYVERAADLPDAELPHYVATAPVGEVPRPAVERVRTAVAALRAAQERWSALKVGDTLVVEWPAHRRLPAAPRNTTRREPARRRR
ncbi:hypothetical protein ABZS66_29960 [Dactylosporangium sp. NPDC005572]|uniref:hypothetical protein n=1 Tax=Dactylosporangium sp. NPDC005572 TaxID=3156889 RepID=UPI0033A4D1CE